MTGAFAAVAGLLALIDPRLRPLVRASLALAALSLIRDRQRFFLPALALALAAPTFAGFSVGADSPVYFAYTSSLLIDHDLDFSNQWIRLREQQRVGAPTRREEPPVRERHRRRPNEARTDGLRVGPGDLQTQWWDDGSSFRYLLFPRGCIVIPLNEPFDLRGFVRARAPARIDAQRLTLSANGHPVAETELPAAWTDVPFTAPMRFWPRGENEFCVTAAKRRPGDEGDDPAYAAAVVRVQLP